MSTTERPNVIIVLTDDQGYGDMSCHGHPVLSTPNIDRLHDESIRLTDFHVAPMCAPTRGELLSGVHCLRNGAMATSLGRHLLKPQLPTLADAFSAGGYATGIFGKWHLGDSYPYRPMDRGFDEAIYHLGFGLTGADAYWQNDYLYPYYRHNGELKRAEGYCTDFWFDSAMTWIREQAEADRPFFCYIPTNVPHFPMWVDDVYKEQFAAYGPDPSGFFGMIVELDENLARLDAFLSRQKLRDDTILLFMTDNGHAGGALDVYNAGMRGGKCSRYDGGHRVPCFIRRPSGDLGAARDIDVPTQAMDIFPTLLSLCDIAPPEGARFDGDDLSPLLRPGDAGEASELRDRMLVVQYYQNSIGKWDASVIWGSWRLVFETELYDLTSDPGQEVDVSAKHPDVLSKMQEFYNRFWARVEPGINVFSPLTVGSPHENPVMLTSCEWEDVRCDGIGSVREAKGGPVGGPWNVEVDRDGTYLLEFRRWPRESNLALDAPAPQFDAAYGSIEEGYALPIAAAVLQVGDSEYTAEAPSGTAAVQFRLDLPAGGTKIHAWFRDRNGKDLCGAYYGYFQRV